MDREVVMVHWLVLHMQRSARLLKLRGLNAPAPIVRFEEENVARAEERLRELGLADLTGEGR